MHDHLPVDAGLDPKKIRDIVEVVDAEPMITTEILELTKWASDYYASFWGEMLRASLPAGTMNESVKPKRRKAVHLTGVESPSQLTPAQKKVVETLRSNSGTMLFTELLEAAGVTASPVNTLARSGVIEITIEDVRRDPFSGKADTEAIMLKLNEPQTAALDALKTSIDSATFKTFLLHGVTGSGKTEVYINAMKHALGRGKSALMLVPEIALTPVFSRRLKSVFRDEVAILHSDLSRGERFDEWRRVRRGEARVVIGTRSAIFAPLTDLGIIVIDEEHDASYRQHESPFYHARDVAVMRAKRLGATAVLGSATPSMESMYNAVNAKYEKLSLPDRFGGGGLAKAELIDMRGVFKRFGKDVPLSPELTDAIRETHERGEQAIILLNRRGFSQFVLCRSCGETMKCKNCDITLTYHRSQRRLRCHYCNYNESVPDVCTACGSEYLYFVGEGTENIAEQLKQAFPGIKIERVDRDTMSKKGEVEDVLMRFERGEIDMLVGTQMIAKGHDFPNVTLVGVVSVDIGLGLPDLRSAERTFQLLTQVAGRSGRGKKPGRVLIQTYYPDHYALRFAVEQDYDGFYSAEIKFRERLAYPPYFVLAGIMIKHRDAGYAMQNASKLRRALDDANADRQSRVSGPAPASVGRLKNEFRYQLLVRSRSRSVLRNLIQSAVADAEAQGCDMRTIFIEIDPVSLL